MNILYIGSSGALSLVPFKHLLEAGYSISAVGVFEPIVLRDKVIALENASLALAANQHAITLIDLSQPVSFILEQCKQCEINLILMSCYSKRLPQALIEFAEYGCFNMHPSLLPRYRGPEPLFWQMKDAAVLGVSWHRVVYEFDAGDVLMQIKVTVDEGATFTEINAQLARRGATLLLDMLSDIAMNGAVGTLVGHKQESARANYYPYPEKQDFVINTQGSARQAYNYMCATQAFGHLYACRVDKYCYYLEQALDYDNNITLDTVEVHQNKLYIPFTEGVLIATYTDKIPA